MPGPWALAADPEGWDPKELDRLNLGNGDELVVAGNGAASSQTAEASRSVRKLFGVLGSDGVLQRTKGCQFCPQSLRSQGEC